MDLKGKHVLMMAPVFFGYEKNIMHGIESMGAVVHLYDERNSPSAVEKILYRKVHVLLYRKVCGYYRRICENEKEFCPDYILFINPETINKYSIKLMRESFPNARFILYMWDSCENKNIKHMFRFFDCCLSFDRYDCEKYNLRFRPLFYVDDFKSQGSNGEYDYAVTFIGTAHSDRLKIVQHIKSYCDDRHLPYFIYVFVPGKLMFFLRKIFNRDFRQFDNKYIHIVPLSKKRVAEILDRTSYILDISHPKQMGLTMRTIEMIGLKRKIITTNNDIRNYDFYNPVNQVIVDRKHMELPDISLNQKYIDVPENIYRRYSLSSWLEEIFN